MLETASKYFEVSKWMPEVTICSGTNWHWGRNGIRMWMNCAYAYLAETAVIPGCSWSVLGSIIPSYSWFDLQAFPCIGHSASSCIISGDWHDRVFLFLLLQGVDSYVLLQQPLIYCHFANGSKDPCYLPVRNWEVLRTFLTEALDNYNELNAAMHLVLFEDAMQHVWVDWLWCFSTK